MKFENKLLLALILVTVTAFNPLLPGNELGSQEKDKLLFEEIPIVVTSSRKEQPITEAASTITVITSEDIHYSGATNIPDVLRMVAGVDVMAITNRDMQVGVRGFIIPVNNKLLVLVDGRTMYTDLYGTIFWDLLPVGMEEIERIEVVKSPASSIYGANAFSGVINIITKTPKKLEGMTMNVTGGENNTLIASILHAGKFNKKPIDYKVSVEWDQLKEKRTDGDKTAGVMRFNALVSYMVKNKGKITVSLGRGHTQDRNFFSGENIGTAYVDYSNDYLQAEAEFGHLQARIFLKDEKPSVTWPLSGESQKWHIVTTNIELLHSFQPLKNHNLVWGIDYRYNKVAKNPFMPIPHTQYLGALFIEDEIKLTNKLRVVLGARYDIHPLVDGHLSPRGNILYSPSKNHTFRISYAQAYRNPTFVDSYIYYDRELLFRLPPPLPPMEIPFSYISRGNPNLEPEAVTSYEIGWRSKWSGFLTCDVNLFYNRYSDFIALKKTTTFYEENELFPGSPGGFFPKQILSSFENNSGATAFGGEISTGMTFNDFISGFINYSYQKFKPSDTMTTFKVLPDNNPEKIRFENPRNKINAGVRFIFKNGFSVNLLGHWVDTTKKMVKETDGDIDIKTVSDNLLVNTRVGYIFWKKKAEVAIAVFNLFNQNHYEFPLDMSSPVPSSVLLGRKITFTARLNF